MHPTNDDLLHAADTLLADLMRTKAGDEVLITADPATDARVTEAVFAAARRLGAHPLAVVVPQLPFQGKLADPFISPAQAKLFLNADVWIDLTFPYIAGAHAHDEAMKGGRVRYMLGGDMNAGAFDRLFGQIDLDAYFDMQYEFDRVFAPGRKCRITCAKGTDVTFTLAKSSLVKRRHADQPGMYVVPGTCSIAPDIATVKGTIVVSHSFHEYYAPLPSLVTLEVDGPIRSMRGGGAAHAPLERALLRAGGGKYGSIIHFAQGMHPAARVTGTSFIEDIRATGSNAVGLGIPWWEPGGGENHPDAVVLEQNVWLDGEPIIEAGQIVAPSTLAKKAAALAPKRRI